MINVTLRKTYESKTFAPSYFSTKNSTSAHKLSPLPLNFSQAFELIIAYLGNFVTRLMMLWVWVATMSCFSWLTVSRNSQSSTTNY